MAADSDGGKYHLVETVVTCEGDLKDPLFPLKFKKIIQKLRNLLCKGIVIFKCRFKCNTFRFSFKKYFHSLWCY